MTHTLPRSTKGRRASGRRTRRGVSMILVLFALTLVLAVTALVVDLGQVISTHEQLRAASESAALAGVVELLDRNVLYPHLAQGRLGPFWQGGNADNSDHAEPARGGEQGGVAGAAATAGGDALTAAQVASARRAAIEFAALNLAAGAPVALEPNFANAPHGDLVIGCVSPAQFGAPLTVWQGHGSCDSLLVRAGRSAARGNPLTLGFGRLLGLNAVSVAAQARASLDRRVVGVRPISGANVPLVPCAVLHAGSRQSWLAQAFAPARAGQNDAFTVNQATGQVTPGADGIPEVELVAPARGAAQANGNFCLLWLPGGGEDLPWFIGQVTCGVGAADLESLGGELLLGSTPCVLCADGAGLADQFPASLAGLCGQTRIWPLGQPQAATSGAAAYRITGFAAGVVVSAALDASGGTANWIVRVQPGVMATRTALVAAGAARNPWVAKLTLTQ